MKTELSKSKGEPRWVTYMKAVGALVPGLVLWASALIFFTPKVRQLWRDAGVNDQASWVMEVLMTLVRYGGAIAIGVCVALALLEFNANFRQRFRRLAVGAAVFSLNSLILFGLWIQCMAAVLAAPGFRGRP